MHLFRGSLLRFRLQSYADRSIVHQRFLNFYGQTYARLGRDQSVYNSVKHPRTPLITFLAPLFWNAPEVHLRGLEKIWTDNVIAIQPWSSFISKLQVEWQEFVLYVRRSCLRAL